MARKAKAKPRPEPEMYTIYADILQETEAADGHEGAVLINCGDAEKIWLPASQIEFDGERGDTNVAIALPDWLADDNGLVDGQGMRAESAPEEEEGSPAVPAGEAVAAVMESIDPPAQPETFTFRADVEGVYAEKIVLHVDNGQGGAASLEFHPDELDYESKGTVDLQEGYSGIEYTIAWALAVEKHLPELLGVMPVPAVAPDARPDNRKVDDKPATATSPFKNFLRKDIVEATVALTDEEQIAYGKAMAEALKERADNKRTASFYSGKAATAEKEAYRIMEILEDGEETRRIHCDVVADYNADQLVYVESEWPHREIQRRSMTDKDRQLPLPILTNRAGTDVSPDAPDTAGDAPAEEKTITLNGRVVDITEDGIITVAFTDSEGNEMEFEISRSDVICADDLQPGEEADFTMALALAIDEGIVDAAENDEDQDAEPQEAETQAKPERSCGTCAHIHQQPNEGEDDPCLDCGQDPDLPNWTDGCLVEEVA